MTPEQIAQLVALVLGIGTGFIGFISVAVDRRKKMSELEVLREKSDLESRNMINQRLKEQETENKDLRSRLRQMEIKSARSETALKTELALVRENLKSEQSERQKETQERTRMDERIIALNKKQTELETQLKILSSEIEKERKLRQEAEQKRVAAEQERETIRKEYAEFQKNVKERTASLELRVRELETYIKQRDDRIRELETLLEQKNASNEL